MFNIKALGLVAGLMTVISAPAFASLQEFAGGTQESFAWTGSNLSVLNGGNVSINVDQLSQAYSGVTMQLGGVNGVATTGLSLNGSGNCLTGLGNYGCFFTTAATSLSYTFATPTNIAGVSVTNLLTVNLAAGVEIDISKARSGAYSVQIGWQKSFGDVTNFTSDLFNFHGFNNITDLLVGFTLTSVTTSNIANGFSAATGSSSFSSDPLPTVPEAPSALLLIVGMTAVAMGARRRAV